jgi:hypothetical protein
MTIPENIMNKLKKVLEVYDEDKYYENYKRKAYIDDNVLIKNGVNVKTVIDVFQLEKKEIYKKYLSEVEKKNNYNNIKKLKERKEQYKIFTLKYNLNNYDYGCDKYDRLQIQEVEETYRYDNNKERYKQHSYTVGGSMINYNMTYMDLIDNTYKTIKDVVTRIKKLEEKL